MVGKTGQESLSKVPGKTWKDRGVLEKLSLKHMQWNIEVFLKIFKMMDPNMMY
jgi:hypothetical protein